MKRKSKFLVLSGLGLGCALLLWAGFKQNAKVSSAVAPTTAPTTVNVKPIHASLSLPPRQITHKGVLYSLPFGNGSSPSMYVYEIDGGVDKGKLHLFCTPHVLHNHNGHLYLMGKSYGAVSYGDHVEVTDANRVFVNGTERPPIVGS